jgi:hypothetical protein
MFAMYAHREIRGAKQKSIQLQRDCQTADLWEFWPMDGRSEFAQTATLGNMDGYERTLVLPRCTTVNILLALLTGTFAGL